MVVALADGSVALGDGPALTIAPTGATASRDTYPSISAGMFATVGGMVACAGSERMVVFVRVSQGDGPMLSRGAARTAVSCTGEPESWHVNVYSDGRPFPAGEADVNAYVSSLPVADDRGEARGEAAITLADRPLVQHVVAFESRRSARSATRSPSQSFSLLIHRVGAHGGLRLP